MTRDDATVLDRTDAVPMPRAAAPAREWAEPVRRARRTRPASDYWDHEDARWVSRPSVPGPRRGD
ncbi:MAG TPA: hypothetical protein VFG13_04660 [Blastococcus sp.]|nr:hypothetical protein [Blastococcus sp.]